MYKLLLPLIVLYCLLLNQATGQNTPPQLAIAAEKEEQATGLPELIYKTGQDTSRVNLLLKVSRIYWSNRKQDHRQLDSCLYWAKAAYHLSNKLQYLAGSKEALFLQCKAYAEKYQPEKAKELLPYCYGEQKVRLLLVIAEHYVFNFEATTAEYPKAYPLIQQAKELCDSIHSQRWFDECIVLLCKYYFGQGNIQEGQKALLQIITPYETAKNYAKAARFWSVMGFRMPENDSTFKIIRHSHERAVHYYTLAGDAKNAAYSLRDLAIVNGNHNQTDSAEKQLLRVVAILTSIGETITPTTYNLIADYYRFTGQYNKALQYALKAMQHPDANRTQQFFSQFVLAQIYEETKDFNNSLRYYRLALDYQLSQQSDIIYLIANRMANTLVEADSATTALAFLQKFAQQHPPALKNNQQQFAATLGNIYTALHNYKAAEKEYLTMLSYNQAVHEENGRSYSHYNNTLTGSGAFFTIGKFYTQRGRFEEGKTYLEKSLQHAQYVDVTQEMETYQMLYRADSALGNYQTAMRYQTLFRARYDSVNNVERARQLNELSIQYQTEQKQKDIELLKNKEQMQKAALEKADFVRNIMIAGAIMLLLLALLATNGYRNKRRSHKKLQQQQQEINTQNQTLQLLLNQKDEYLKEKEWLVKEIHHRVKNNLQIIMSLLSTQSEYLATGDAKDAIQESKNRVKSIALLHQKLYKSNEEARISIQSYVSDLLTHLEDGFNTEERNIVIDRQVCDTDIDLSQAVPVGLILNEAITNAIKYAFAEEGGRITVQFCQTDKKATLAVTDNGKGLPPDFQPKKSRSLGMEMMHGLTQQLKGTIQVTGQQGTAVVVHFPLR